MPLDFYPSFVVDDDPASGFAAGPPPPRFSHGYWALHNRFALLVETHSWKDYPTRVRVTHNIIVSLAEMMAAQGAQWRTLQREADSRAARLGWAGCRAGLRQWAARDDDRLPGLRLHARAFGDLRRAGDPLRQQAGRRCGTCRSRM